MLIEKSTQTAANLPLQTGDKNQWTLLFVGFNSRNNIANLGSFANFFIPLRLNIPCYYML